MWMKEWLEIRSQSLAKPRFYTFHSCIRCILRFVDDAIHPVQINECEDCNYAAVASVPLYVIEDLL